VIVPASEAVLNLARALLFMREINGANRSELIDEMIRRTGLDPAKRLPWCAAFVAWVGYAVLRKTWPLRKVAGCMSLYDDAVTKELLRQAPAPGAVFLLWGKGPDGVMRFKHAGFVVGPSAAAGWSTIEGNTNEAGHPDGVGVFERVRQFGPSDRFIHWWDQPITTPPIAA
jgi:hypothetical protein